MIFFFSRTSYGNSLFQVYAWLDSLVESYPGFVTSIVGGASYLGRQIKGVKVSYKAENPVVILEGGVSLYLTRRFGFLS
jgi:carboxypeptidase A